MSTIYPIRARYLVGTPAAVQDVDAETAAALIETGAFTDDSSHPDRDVDALDLRTDDPFNRRPTPDEVEGAAAAIRAAVAGEAAPPTESTPAPEPAPKPARVARTPVEQPDQPADAAGAKE